MRILCLHGKGTSGSILKSQTCSSPRHATPSAANSQTASFRTHLSDIPIEFTFLDGPFPSPPAAGIDLFYQPPYYSFTEENTLEALHASCKWLADHLARAGPYDAVMGFSQGCYIAASFLLLHQINHSNEAPPFKAGIFICGGAPLSLAESLGFSFSEEVWERDRAGREALFAQADSEAILAKGADRWTGSAMHDGIDEEQVRRGLQGPCSIGIPTVHVYGNKDPRYVAGVQLSGLCVEETRRVFDHGGGHEIPRTDVVSRSIAGLIKWALEQGEQERM